MLALSRKAFDFRWRPAHLPVRFGVQVTNGAFKMTSSSPKRKRDHPLALDAKKPVTRLVFDEDGEDAGDASPRTKAARRFEHLEIDSRPFQRYSEAGRKQPAVVRGLQEFMASGTGDNGGSILEEANSEAKNRSDNTAITHHFLETTARGQGANSTRSMTPPMTAEASESFWLDSEITGHNPDDPDDDGYGINGIGFRPTAAIAWSRSQRRKQQLNEYRTREAREARQQRSERRKRFINDSDDIPSTQSSPRKSIRVHFEDG